MSRDISEIEKVVEGIWKKVLNVAAVQCNDNFLDIGGNSLEAGEIVWHIKNECGIEVPIDTIVSDGTFGSLVDAVRDKWTQARA